MEYEKAKKILENYSQNYEFYKTVTEDASSDSELEWLADELKKQRKEIIRRLKRMRDTKARQFLYYRYIKHIKLKDIPTMPRWQYEERQIYRLQRKAIEKFARCD